MNKIYTVKVRQEANNFCAYSEDFVVPAYSRTPQKAVDNLIKTIYAYNKVVEGFSFTIANSIDNTIINGDV